MRSPTEADPGEPLYRYIEIFDDFSTVDLPAGMPAETIATQNTWVCQQPWRFSPLSEFGSGERGAGRKNVRRVRRTKQFPAHRSDRATMPVRVRQRIADTAGTKSQRMGRRCDPERTPKASAQGRETGQTPPRKPFVARGRQERGRSGDLTNGEPEAGPVRRQGRSCPDRHQTGRRLSEKRANRQVTPPKPRLSLNKGPQARRLTVFPAAAFHQCLAR